MDVKVFWGNVKSLITEQNTSQDWVAEYCNISPRTFQNWLYRNRFPSICEGQQIAAALGTTVEYLVTGRPPEGLSAQAMDIARAAERLNDTGKKAALAAVEGLLKDFPLQASDSRETAG
jgi:transcriptional regulator with XRE-family HTH domain